MTDNEHKKATPEEEALAETAEVEEERKHHYAEMNKKSHENRNEGKVG